MNADRSAAELGKAAMSAVSEGRREDWLELFAIDARVEDPVGHLPPVDGREALAAFWDAAIAPLRSVRLDVTRVWDADREALLLADVSLVAPNGTDVAYDGAFGYRADAEGRIGTLRAFWDLPQVMAALAAEG